MHTITHRAMHIHIVQYKVHLCKYNTQLDLVELARARCQLGLSHFTQVLPCCK